jgi:oxygen-independent coproporphyrinogen-3 oxidase
MLQDLKLDLSTLATPRPLTSVFIGGGTPSLLSGRAVGHLLRGVRESIGLAPSAEVTLEANPGTADAGRFASYREAGVDRLSIGAQSLSGPHLVGLGRIHGPADVCSAVDMARKAGFANLNLDLMYALPGQSLSQAGLDLDAALSLHPEHLSYYQLTLEPNTAFHRMPPSLPDEDLAADMHEQGAQMLASAGFEQYEVSAYARIGHRCVHNLNYWRFGDYLGIGAGAHGKLTDPAGERVERLWKLRHPDAYLCTRNKGSLVAGRRKLSRADLVLEFAMSSLRLREGFDRRLFEQRTGLAYGCIATSIDAACTAGLLSREEDRIRPTDLGHRFLNDLLQYFDLDPTG